MESMSLCGYPALASTTVVASACLLIQQQLSYDVRDLLFSS
jgi:hypothetical protein